jgi:phosphohistidine phosphatase
VPELILMRHAAALPAAIDGSDFDRPLSARGRSSALQAARRLRAAGLNVERLLFSPARRTRETTTIAARELGLGDSALQPVPEMYAATPRTLHESLVKHHAGAQILLMIGHNPGISEFGGELAAAHAREQLPTAEFWCLPFDAQSWQRLLQRGGAGRAPHA